MEVEQQQSTQSLEINSTQTSQSLDSFEEELKQTYAKLLDTITSVSSVGWGLNVYNFTELLQQVMETVERLGELRTMSGAQKCQMAQDLSTKLLKDLHDRKLVSDNFYEQSSQAVQYLGPAIFTAIVLASKGKILINQVVDDVKSSQCYQTKCAGKCCVL